MEKCPNEILLLVFSYLDTKNIMLCQRVCKRFRLLCQDPILYTRLHFDDGLSLSSNIFKDYVSKHHSRIKRLVLQNYFWIPSHKLVMTLQRCENLIELDVTGCRLSSSGLLKVMAKNPGIQKLCWTLPTYHVLTEANNGLFKRNDLLNEMKKAFKNLSSIILNFEAMFSFEEFLPVFDTEDLFINEFGLNYLKSSSSNSYGIYLKTKEKFHLQLEDAAVSNRFLHFNRLIMDFIIQIVYKAAETKSITSLLARGNTICWLHITPVLSTYSFEQLDLSVSLLAKEHITWLSKLKNLTHLNLSHVGQFKANLMKAIASTCTDLVSLNLSCCEDWISKDLYGLEAVAKHCTKLEKLNLSCLHIHATSKDLNRLCSIVGTMNNLKALSLPACSLVNNIAVNHHESPQKSLSANSPLARAESFKSKVTSNLLFSLDSSNISQQSSSSQGTGGSESIIHLPYPTTRLSRLISDSENLVNAIGSGLDPILEGCRGIEELEIIDTGFHSAFSRVVIDQFLCPLTSYLRDNNFKELTKLVHLRKLTLAGLSSVGAFNSLAEITAKCCNLEYLSIAHCGLAGHSNSLLSLRAALSHCRRLKHFRLDQPYYRLKEDLLESFSACSSIQTICFICKNGKAPKLSPFYVNLFDKCKQLVVFILFCGLIKGDCKKIQSELDRRYSAKRPPLCVSVLPYNIALTKEGLKNIPNLYLDDVIHFESRVAVSKINR